MSLYYPNNLAINLHEPVTGDCTAVVKSAADPEGLPKDCQWFSESAHCSTSNCVDLLTSCKSGLPEFELDRTMRDVIDLG